MSIGFSDDSDHRNSAEGCINMYDVRLRDSYPSCGMSWPPDLESVTPYLRVVSSKLRANVLATGCSECSKYRYHQEKAWLARMFRCCLRVLPCTQLSSSHHSAPISSGNRSYPPFQRRSGSHLQPFGNRRNDFSDDMAQRYGLRRSPWVRILGASATVDLRW